MNNEENIDINNFVITKPNEMIAVAQLFVALFAVMIAGIIPMLCIEYIDYKNSGSFMTGLVLICSVLQILMNIGIIKWKLEINDNGLIFKPAFVKPKKFSFSEITKVRFINKNAKNHFTFVGIVMYSGKKRVGLITASQVGYYKLVERLEKEGVEID